MASVTGDSSRITKMIKETVVLLCENSLSFTSELHVQALLAISVDRSTIFAVQIDEKLAKNGETVGGVSSGSSGTQGQVLSEQRPSAARRLALPAPSVSSPLAQNSTNDGSGLAWPLRSPQAAPTVRTRGPRFPVGRGRGTLRGGRGRGRGGATIRGGAPPVRMIRTAVSSIKFPVSRPRMQVPQRAVRPVGVRSPYQRLALPPATGGSAGNSPRQLAAAVVRQRVPAPVRQTMYSAGAQRSASQPMMRKPSPRLAIMPPAQSSSTAPGLRQQAASMVPRQAGSATSPRGVGRPRLAIMPPPQHSALANSQSPPGLRQQSPSMLPRQTGSAQAATSPRGVGRPRLAIMPSSQHSSLANCQSPPGLRQQSPSTLPRKTASVRAAASPQHVGRPRMASVSSSQLPSFADSQSLVLRSPTQPRAVPRQSSTRLALMPPPQSSIRSPSGNRQQTPASPANSQLQFVGRQQSPHQQSPAVVKQEYRPGVTHHLTQLATQLSSSSVGTQLHAVVEHLSKQQRQPSPARQSTPVNLPTAVTVPVTIQSMHSPPARLTPVQLSPFIAANLSQTGNVQVFSGVTASTQSPRTSSRPVHGAAELPSLMSSMQSPSRSVVMPVAVVEAQQRVAVTSTASIPIAAASCQPVSVTHTSHPQPFLMTQSPSGIPNAVSNMMARSGGTTVAQRLGMQSPRAATLMATQPSEMMAAFLPAALRAQFSPAQLQSAASQQLTAVPLYAGPTQASATVPTLKTDVGDTQRHIRGILPGDVVMPGTPFSIGHVSGDTVTQPAGTATKQSLLSPLTQPSASHLQQQRVMFQFSPQHQVSSSASQSYSVSSLLMGDVTHSPQRLESHVPATAQQQQQSHSAPRVSSLAQSPISPAYVQFMSQNPKQVPSLAPRQVSVVASEPQRRQRPEHVASVQSEMPAAAPQQFVLNAQDVLTPAQRHMFPGYVPKVTPSSQQLTVQTSAVTVPRSHQQEVRMQNEMSSLQQLMQFRHQVTASTAGQMRPATVQHGQRLPGQLDASHMPRPQSQRTEASQSAIREQSNPAVSLSQRVAQATVGGMEEDRLAVLEIIKQQAFEQLRQVRQTSDVQHRTVTAASSSIQVPSPGTPTTPRQVALTSIPQETVMQASHHGRQVLASSTVQVASPSTPRQVALASEPEMQVRSQIGQVSELRSPRQPVPAALSQAGYVATPGDRQQLTVSEQGTQQPPASSVTPSVMRQTVSGLPSHIEALLFNTLQQAVVSTSSQSVQVAAPAGVQQQRQVSEPSSQPQSYSSSATSSPQIHPSYSSASHKSIFPVSSSLAITQHSGAVSVGASAQHDSSLTKEKLLQLKEKVQKKGSVEVDRQKIISEQLQQFHSDVTGVAETTADDVESCSSDTVVAESSVSNISLAKSSELGE